jgi:NADH dehydrogenase
MSKPVVPVSGRSPHIVVIGAGFGGIAVARALPKDANVTIVDQHNYQTFLPLLYQVASSGLAADQIAYPVRAALRGTSANFRLGTAQRVDAANQLVKLADGTDLHYDHLILAAGSVTNDYGVSGVSEFAFGMKSLKEALTIRATFLRRFEELASAIDDGRKVEPLSVVIIGGGPTGVEMAGALAELSAGPLAKDRKDAASMISVELIELGDRILSTFAPALSARAAKDLESLGVRIHLNTSVQSVSEREIGVAGATSIPANLTIWAAGVRGVDLGSVEGAVGANGRLRVDETLRIDGSKNIWVIGDLAGALGPDGRPLPMVAPVAIQQGRHVARQITGLQRGADIEHFVYKDKGSMATIGRHKAIVETKRLHFGGFVAWFAWLGLHLVQLMGGRNRVGTLADWSWNYLTFDRGNRHIIDVE